jgi:TetR/AcrR family transcriptional regulator, transcriptional repressor for nem operon
MTDSRHKLFAAALVNFAEKGYAATTVDEICAKAGVTKGAFFHHFPSKQSLAIAAVNNWAEKWAESDSAASYQNIRDPLDRFLGYLDFQKVLLRSSSVLTSGVVGLLMREVSQTYPELARVCGECLSGQFEKLQSNIAEAMTVYAFRGHLSPKSLALHVQATLQGTYILAKPADSIAVASESVDHLRLYVELLFARTSPIGKKFTAAGDRNPVA